MITRNQMLTCTGMRGNRLKYGNPTRPGNKVPKNVEAKMPDKARDRGRHVHVLDGVPQCPNHGEA
jgi:hypothetical protein